MGNLTKIIGNCLIFIGLTGTIGCAGLAVYAKDSSNREYKQKLEILKAENNKSLSDFEASRLRESVGEKYQSKFLLGTLGAVVFGVGGLGGGYFLLDNDKEGYDPRDPDSYKDGYDWSC